MQINSLYMLYRLVLDYVNSSVVNVKSTVASCVGDWEFES